MTRLAEVRAVVVGTGFIGMAHVDALRRLGVEVAGLVGSSPDRASIKAAPAGLEVYDDLEAALSDPSVDVVHVATPNHGHHAQAMAVIAAGKHVVCEKPLGLNGQESAALAEAARRAGVVHAVCFNLRFYPIAHQMKAMVAAGEIGEPRLIHGVYLQDWLLRETDWNWRLDPRQAGGMRAVADIGSHWLDLAWFVTDRRIEEVMAELHTFLPVRRRPTGPVESFAAAAPDTELVTEKISSDDAASIMLRLGGGCRGQVTVSQVAAGHNNRLTMEVDGAEGALSWSSEQPDRLWIGRRGDPNQEHFRDPAAMYEPAARVTVFPAGHVEGFGDTFRGLFSTVYADVVAGAPSREPAYPTFDDGHETLCVTEAVAESSSTGRWTSVRPHREA